ncbi:MAG: ParB/RepB/Spo0J family partition protein [Bacillota bacterium]|nr:ParB/RepB/Spo0J family partition protein [Bacillota bacterium]
MVRWFGGSASDQILQISVNDIKPNPYQPRKTFTAEKIHELSESIKEVGIIQPLVVRKMGSNYELVAGERRLRAAIAAGLTAVPVVVKQYTDQEVAQATLIENIQREDLNVLEEAKAYDQLLIDFRFTQDELAKRMGLSQSTIANKRRLLKLPQEVQDMLLAGSLNERQARALLKLDSHEAQASIARQVVEEDLTVKQVEDAVERFVSGDCAEDAVAAASAKPIRKFLVRDVRIFVNSIRHSIQLMKQSGVQAQVEEKDSDDFYEVVVRIPKRK